MGSTGHRVEPDELPQVSRFHDGGTPLHAGESSTLCTVPELRVLSSQRKTPPAFDWNNERGLIFYSISASREIFTLSTQAAKQEIISALRELKARAGALLTIFLALLLSRITRQITGSLQGDALCRIQLLERASDAMAQRTGLTGGTPTAQRRLDIVAADGLGLVEGRTDQDLVRRSGEVLLVAAAVALDLAGAGPKADARDGRLALAGGLDVNRVRQGEAPLASGKRGDDPGRRRLAASRASDVRGRSWGASRERPLARHDPNEAKPVAFPP